MEIAKLVVKKLKSTLSDAEQKEFDSWYCASFENKETFERIKFIHKSGKDISELETLDELSVWEEILKKINSKGTDRKKIILASSIFKYAAIFIGLFGMAFWYFFNNWQADEDIIPMPNKNAITLQLDNGEIRVLSEDGFSVIKDEQGNTIVSKEKSNLSYSDSSAVDKLVYNTLTVPYAKRFGIKLSDGTRIHLNSGSTIKYPVKFIKGSQQEVFLTGQAFFEVTEDAAHPFVVNSDEMAITVLGTTFNVEAYPEDKEIKTVLVTGAVGISNKQKSDMDVVLLKPGHMASWNKTAYSVDMQPVDTDIYTSWIDGRLVLKRATFIEIIPKLQRHFNVSIKNDYINLNDEVFTASYDIETIEEVLGSLNAIIPFFFEVNGNEITIRKPKTI